MSAREARHGRHDAAGTGSSAPIDLAHLERQTFGSRDLEREVLDLFVAQARDLIEGIAATAGAARAALVHRLKGSARGVGATRIADLADALEAPDLAPAEAGGLVAALRRAAAEVAVFVAALGR